MSTTIAAANLASTMSISGAGELRRSSSVPPRRSSANSRMVTSGTSRTSCMADWKKMWTSVACLDKARVTTKL